MLRKLSINSSKCLNRRILNPLAKSVEQRRNLNIHEYQAKMLLGQFNVPHQRGIVVQSLDEVRSAAEKVQKQYHSNYLIVKSQILAGGRGKGVFDNGYKGGVKFTKSIEEAEQAVQNMLGHRLITKQTPKEGIKVQKIYIAECLDFQRELYLALLLDRQYDGPVFIASTEGGMDIEAVAEKTPEKIHKVPIDIIKGPTQEQLADLAQKLGFTGETAKRAIKLFFNLYDLFVSTDAIQVEINPLVQTNSGDVVCVDAKINFDDNAEFRRKEIFEMRDYSEEDPREVEASKYGLNYVGLEGDIGCMVNGAGLAMATMDIIHYHGGKPANFLDVGGGATAEQVKRAFTILISDKNVKAILVNIFGGIMRCDTIAKGIIEAAKEVGLKVPLVVRLEGTNVEQGVKLLQDSGLMVITAKDLDDAATKAVSSIKK